MKVLIVLLASMSFSSISFAAKSVPYPTKFHPVGQSLEMLLNDGWSVRSSAPSHILLSKSTKYVLCNIKKIAVNGTTSCFLLN